MTCGPGSDPRLGGMDTSRTSEGCSGLRMAGGAASSQTPPYFWETHPHLFRLKGQSS